MENKKNSISTILFIILSLTSLLILGVIYFIFLGFNSAREDAKIKAKQKENTDRYYLNYDFEYSSGFITKVPSLEDILTGPIITSSDPSLGNEKAEVVIVEFSDFECEYCREQEVIIKDILDKYQNQIRFVWKDYPERDPTSVSYQAALAARCAQKQGKFWEYHDQLYQEDKLNNAVYPTIAQEIGLNTRDFKDCYQTMLPAALINDNIEEANALDISGIPFVYINDQEIMGGASQEDLERIIDIELGKKNP